MTFNSCGARAPWPLLVLLAMSVSAQRAPAQDQLGAAAGGSGSALVAQAVRVDQAPEIDGVLDEAFWASLPAIADFVQREPLDGGTPSERTQVRIAYDDKALYFGIELFDSEPGLIRRSILHREGRIDQDDRVVIALDSYDDDK